MKVYFENKGYNIEEVKTFAKVIRFMIIGDIADICFMLMRVFTKGEFNAIRNPLPINRYQ